MTAPEGLRATIAGTTGAAGTAALLADAVRLFDFVDFEGLFERLFTVAAALPCFL
jgi:hypothetical protein